MPRPRNNTPVYTRHGQADRARAVWTDSNGKRQFRLLPGPFNSTESAAAFGRLLLEQMVGPQPAAVPAEKRDTLTLAELLDAYLLHAQRHYRRADGKPTSELAEVKVTGKGMR